MPSGTGMRDSTSRCAGPWTGGGVKLRNRALAPRNRSAAEHQSFAWLRGRLPEYNKT